MDSDSDSDSNTLVKDSDSDSAHAGLVTGLAGIHRPLQTSLVDRLIDWTRVIIIIIVKTDPVLNKQYSATRPFGQNDHISVLGSVSNVSYNMSGVIRDPPIKTLSSDHTDVIRPK